MTFYWLQIKHAITTWLARGPGGVTRPGLLLATALGGGAFFGLLSLLVTTPATADPAIAIEVSPSIQDVVPGGTASFSITFTNTGTITLTQIAINAAGVSGCSINFATFLNLAPGDPYSYPCSTGPHYEDTVNDATITAVPEGGGGLVSSSDSAVIRATNLLLLITPERQEIGSGQNGQFTFKISNIGGFVISDITISETLTPNCGRAAGVLASLNPGESHSYSCRTDSLFLDFEMVATAAALISGTTPVKDIGYATVGVLTPLELTVSPPRQTILAGTQGTVTLTLVNAGGSTLTGLSVAAAGLPACNQPAGNLADLPPGHAVSYTCDTGFLTDDVIGIINASGQDGTTPIEAISRVELIASPKLDIEVAPAMQIAQPGVTTTFAITLTSRVDRRDLTGISVAAPTLPGCGRAAGDLADLSPGQALTYSCEHQVAAGLYDHQLTAFGELPDEDPVQDIAHAFAGLYETYLPMMKTGN